MAIDVGPGAAPMKRVAAACLVGSTIEFYDFSIYGAGVSWAVSLMLAAFALASLVCTYLLPETNGTTLQTSAAASPK